MCDLLSLLSVLLDQSCQSVMVNYQGFKITWNDTLAGTTVEVPCAGTGLNGQSYICIYNCMHTSKLYSYIASTVLCSTCTILKNYHSA